MRGKRNSTEPLSVNPNRNHNTRYLYTVYRNSDDKMMIMDGTGEECARVMGLVSKFAFYHWWHIQKGYSKYWTVYRTTVRELEEEYAE